MSCRDVSGERPIGPMSLPRVSHATMQKAVSCLGRCMACASYASRKNRQVSNCSLTRENSHLSICTTAGGIIYIGVKACTRKRTRKRMIVTKSLALLIPIIPSVDPNFCSNIRDNNYFLYFHLHLEELLPLCKLNRTAIIFAYTFFFVER